MKRIILLLQILTSITVITVNSIVLYQFLHRSGCTAFQFNVKDATRFKDTAVEFGDCVKRAVHKQEVPKKEILPTEPPPPAESSPVVQPVPLVEESPAVTPSPVETSPVTQPSPTVSPPGVQPSATPQTSPSN
ncbi:MAG: hypothetical protein RID53_31110 [Coleofasciculus sp. B1-GNL1-01]|uniref:hypothetical protein n=1 Tax=Coleofasciculus sp. B1-GNL1-01 TaxID=3068484 RepID=UPI0033022089